MLLLFRGLLAFLICCQCSRGLCQLRKWFCCCVMIDYSEKKKKNSLAELHLRFKREFALATVNIPGWRFAPTKMNMKIMEIDKEINGLLRGVISNREKAIEAGEPSKDDVLSILLDSNHKEIHEHENNRNFGLSIEQVIEECRMFYFAGQETTAVLLAWTMISLGHYQNWQAHAREEVLQVFGSNKPDFDGLTRLKIVT